MRGGYLPDNQSPYTTNIADNMLCFKCTIGVLVGKSFYTCWENGAGMGNKRIELLYGSVCISTVRSCRAVLPYTSSSNMRHLCFTMGGVRYHNAG